MLDLVPLSITYLFQRGLIPQRGLGGAIRVTAYIILGSLLIANCLLTIPKKDYRDKFPLPRLDLVKYSSEKGYIFAAVGYVHDLSSAVSNLTSVI